MPKKTTFKLETKLWIYPGHAAWHFLTIPKIESSAIKESFGANARGWGSLPAEVKVGQTNWRTSIFPDRKAGTYLLPIKAAVRKTEGLFSGEAVKYTVKIKI